MDKAAYSKNWISPVHRIGRISLITLCITSFLPVLYLYFGHGISAPVDWLVKDMTLLAAAFGLIWLIEPMVFYPALGLAGCYMAFMGGNIGNNKLPSAVLAQEVTNTEQGTKAAEVITVQAICGATFTTVAIVCVGAAAGALILGSLPAAFVGAIKAYMVPSIFGALIVTFAIKFPKIIPVAVGVPLLLRLFTTIPSYWFVLITLVCTVVATLTLYKKEVAAGRAEAEADAAAEGELARA
jgi:hypothetical protein